MRGTLLEGFEVIVANQASDGNACDGVVSERWVWLRHLMFVGLMYLLSKLLRLL